MCEDNGIGISVPTPPGWIKAAYGNRPGLKYFSADGCDPLAVYAAAAEAAVWARERRQPAFLHLRVVRLMGHAGSDAESGYRSPADIAAGQARDPLTATARLLVRSGVASPSEIIGRYESMRGHVLAAAQDAAQRPPLRSAVEIMAPLAPAQPAPVARIAARAADARARRKIFGRRLPAVDGRVCVFLEPIALYHTRDLQDSGDGGWLAPYPAPSSWSAGHVPLGSGRTYGHGTDLTLVTFGNGLRLSLRAARRLAAAGTACRVLDLRWLAPLPVPDLLREAGVTGRVLVVDETRRTGGVSEGVLAALADHGFPGPVARVASADSFIPLGDAARHVLVSEEEIEKAAAALTRRARG